MRCLRLLLLLALLALGGCASFAPQAVARQGIDAEYELWVQLLQQRDFERLAERVPSDYELLLPDGRLLTREEFLVDLRRYFDVLVRVESVRYTIDSFQPSGAGWVLTLAERNVVVLREADGTEVRRCPTGRERAWWVWRRGGWVNVRTQLIGEADDECPAAAPHAQESRT